MTHIRTTVTLESDVVDLLEKATRERGVSFKDAVNGQNLQL